MNEPLNHHREARELLRIAASEPESSQLISYYVAAAQAHATLALVEELRNLSDRGPRHVGREIGEALARSTRSAQAARR